MIWEGSHGLYNFQVLSVNKNDNMLDAVEFDTIGINLWANPRYQTLKIVCTPLLYSTIQVKLE